VSDDPLRVPEYLGHILVAIQRINRYTAGMSEAAFLGADLVQDVVIRNIEIIGEASRNVARHHPDFAAQHADVPWEDIYLMRNRVSHGYFTVDLEIIWKTVRRDIPELEAQAKRLLAGFATGGSAGDDAGGPR